MQNFKKYIKTISASALFKGMTESEIFSVLRCLHAQVNEYKKDEYIFRQGDNVDSICLTLVGAVCVVKEDYWGNRNILNIASSGQLFAQAYACLSGTPLRVDVVADAPATVLMLKVRRILTTCSSACEFHSRLIGNILSVLAANNLRLTEKVMCLSQRTTRNRLLSYLSAESERCSSVEFDIPLNRQQLADFLAVDRSAMSAQLCQMRDEGILEFSKNHFRLLNTNEE